MAVDPMNMALFYAEPSSHPPAALDNLGPGFRLKGERVMLTTVKQVLQIGTRFDVYGFGRSHGSYHSPLGHPLPITTPVRYREREQGWNLNSSFGLRVGGSRHPWTLATSENLAVRRRLPRKTSDGEENTVKKKELTSGTLTYRMIYNNGSYITGVSPV
ncbi:hypothetical protein EVAR_99720_1 [Eumeta japonica]|uniref:Uncharacterized protein n=1 Tax=Eumeta variegata TaxID=151549 RepID=A0A4C1ZNG6_EUMVA|nr:hypothetical protein EVAR_99720_1 [Eumeta japonica]